MTIPSDPREGSETDSDGNRPLPEPNSPMLDSIFRNREVREAYRFLYERRHDPPTMSEWREEARGVFGRANEQLDRRLRDVRQHFVVLSRPRGGDWVYQLVGWQAVPAAAATVPSRLQAKVFSVKGRYCAMCGARPAEDNRVRLEIDHIIPASWGGETVFENLEPLCTTHNHGKQAFFSTLDPYKQEIAAALGRETPWERIGELLKALAERGERTPSQLVAVVARETHKGDPARRLRDLRIVLGWDIKPHKSRSGGVTTVVYELRNWKPWPAEGPREVVNRYERERRLRKTGRDEHA